MATSNPLLARLKKLIKRIPIARNKKAATPKQPAATPTIPTQVTAPEQPKEVVQQQPIIHQDSSSVVAASTMPTLQIALQNQTTSNEVYAYISERDSFDMMDDLTNPEQPDKPSTTETNYSASLQMPKRRITRLLHLQPVRTWPKISPSTSVRPETPSPPLFHALLVDVSGSLSASVCNST
jgi:hypothetical protein